MKLQRLLIPLLFAFSFHANAAIHPGSSYPYYQPISENSDLVLTVWDTTSRVSYTLDLGSSSYYQETHAAWFSLSEDENWRLFMNSVSSTANIKWDMSASKRDQRPYGVTPIGQEVDNGVMITSTLGSSDSITSLSYGILNTLQTNFEQYTQILNQGSEDYTANRSYFRSGDDYAGNSSVWGSWAGNIDNTAASYGEKLQLWHLTTKDYGRHRELEYHSMGNWVLNSNGFGFDWDPYPVPVPAAVWLFGSALAGFIGISRRKRS